MLQDYLFRYIAAECGRLGMAVHLHTMAGAGSYFDVSGANPLLLESVLNDPELRKTKFVMVHGGWPFTHEITPLLEKPNAYLDISAQTLLLTPPTLGAQPARVAGVGAGEGAVRHRCLSLFGRSGLGGIGLAGGAARTRGARPSRSPA